MNDTSFASVEIGVQLPELHWGPIDRALLARYAAASGDDNPIHLDADYARRIGADDVFAHGMLSAAVLGRVLTQWVPQPQIREFRVRFIAITKLHRTLACRGVIVEKIEQAGETLVRVNVSAATEDGETTPGSALIAFDQVAAGKNQGANRGQA